MILATLAEVLYTPTTWNNTSHLTRRLLFLLATLALTTGPTFYITVVENRAGGGGFLALILGECLFRVPVSGHKFTEPYFFLTLTFCDPIRAMPSMYEGSGLLKLFGNSVVTTPFSPVYRGPHTILPGHVPVVYHLEY